ncbi:hypothetical protein ONZ45_g12786 [Pleurotus djamor]|nr:hypothetical protein ONZ45_g12786 [Pleurotus djamor]
MYDIALPVLYGHITIEGTSPYYEGFYGEFQTNPMYTRCGNLPSNHEHLTLTKEFILKIGRESLLDKMSAHYELSTVIASMPNLKKLHMSLPSTPDVILKTIPSDNCFRLTHLSLISGVTSATTLRILVAQPTLQYVDLGVAVFQDLPLPSFALPCLQTFIGDSGLWDVFVNKSQRPVEHLAGRIHHTTSFRHPHETFRNIKTLKIDFPNAANFRLMSPYLESIEYLNLRAYGREPKLSAKDLSCIPSSTLRYICVSSRSVSNPTAHKSALFNAFPSLKAVDYANGAKPPSEVSRYIRDSTATLSSSSSLPMILCVPWYLGPWEVWWKALRRYFPQRRVVNRD